MSVPNFPYALHPLCAHAAHRPRRSLERCLEASRIRHGNRTETRELFAQVADDCEQALVARCLVQKLMELDIRPYNTLHIVLLDRASDGDEQAFQALLLLIRNAFCRKFTGKCLECCTNLKDLIDIADGYAGNIGAAARDGDNISLLLQLADRLAHRRAADQQFIC